MKSLLSLLLAAFLLALCPGMSQAETAKPEKVRIGYLSLVNGQLLSKYLKLHEKEMGLPVEWYRFNSGRDVNTAMASDSIDFGNVGLPPATIGLAGGMDYWGIMNANVLGAVESLVVKPEINSLKDLEGKTVVTPFGSTSHYLLIKALRDAGVDLAKVKIMDMAPGEALAPFIRGDIDAAYIWEPSLGLVVQNGGKILLTSEDMAKNNDITWDMISVKPEFARKYPDIVNKFIISELKAMDYWREHPDEAAKIIAEELGGISEADARRMMGGTRLLGLEEQLSPAFLGTSGKKGQSAQDIVNVAGFLLEQGRIKNDVSKARAEEFIHPEFLEKVRAAKTAGTARP